MFRRKQVTVGGLAWIPASGTYLKQAKKKKKSAFEERR
jgi:hypothetical protein